MTLQTTFVDRRMLVRKWPLILGVAPETELIGVGRVQIVSGITPVWIMAIQATHLGFADGVMVWQIGLSGLGLMAPQAVVIQLKPGLERFLLGLSLAMNGVAIDALQVLGLMRSREPVPNMLRLRVATQANAIARLRRTITKADDFVLRICTGRGVQTARTVTLFALDVLHRMEAVTEVLGGLAVALLALLRPGFLRARNIHELAEVFRLFGGVSGGAVIFRRKLRSPQTDSEEQRTEEQSASTHNALQGCYTVRVVPEVADLCDRRHSAKLGEPAP